VEINNQQAAEGRIFDVLVDGISPKNHDLWQGVTRGGKTVHFAAGRDLTGQIVRVRAKSGHMWGFHGDLV
jgi:hypothetical protein